VPKGSDNVWLQLNLYASQTIDAFRARAVCSGEECAPGLLEFEVWVSDDYQQTYTDPSKRCFVGEAPSSGWADNSYYAPCAGQGRYTCGCGCSKWGPGALRGPETPVISC